MNTFLRRPKLLIKLLFGYIIAIISMLYRKREEIVFIGGGDDSNFLDNCKHLYLHMHEQGFNVLWVTPSLDVFNNLQKLGLKVKLLKNRKDYNYLLGTKVLIVDTISWVEDLKYFYLFGAKKIQLWHGVGLKRIELNSPEVVQSTSIYDRLSGRFPKYDIVISPSEFSTVEYLQPSFGVDKKNFIHTGYPRNDVFFSDTDKVDIDISSDVKEQVLQKINIGWKLALYVPTFRDSKRPPINFDEMVGLNQFAEEQKIIVILKFHPYVNFDFNRSDVSFQNIILYPANKDVYPLFRYVDLMITDYSSIYIDFLLLNRPVLFYCFDYEKYIAQDRGMVFDYSKMTPGDKVSNFEDLLYKIKLNLEQDAYSDERRDVCNLIFEHKDGLSSQRITNSLIARNFIKLPSRLN
tara:strand:- start:1891 stop:3108 length:1218 start_codon:yes stop_codon:yes gene_type:complete